MKKVLIPIALIACCSAANAVTVDELTTNTWMPEVNTTPSCETPATITFGKDGKFFSEPGCNDMFGAYQVGENGSITFDHVGMTNKFCAKEYMDQEQNFLKIFNNIKYIEKDGTTLKLFDQNHKPIGAFVPEKAGSCT